MNLHGDNEFLGENFESEVEATESSIFTRPEEVKLKPRKFNKNIYKVVVGLLAIAILVTGLVVLLNLDNEEYINGGVESEPEELVNLVDVDVDDIVSISISNEAGEFTIIRDDDSDFTIDGVAEYIPLSQSALVRTVTHLTEINAQRNLGVQENLNEFGLENPHISAKIVFEDGSEVSLQIGDSNAVDTGMYMIFNDEESIYLSEFMFENELSRSKYDYVDLLAADSLRRTNANSRFFDEGEVKGFTGINISGTMHERPISISWTPDALVNYHITSPVNEYVSVVAIDQLLSPLNVGLFASGAYAFSPTAEQLAEFGLDNPQSIIEYVVGNFSLRVSVGKQDDDGFFAVKVNNVPIIYRMNEGQIAFAITPLEELMWGSVVLVDISTLQAVTFELDGEQHRFELSHRLDEMERNQITVTYNGETKIAQDFQAIYQNILQLQAISRAQNAGVGDPTLTITFESAEGEEDVVLEFFGYSARRYLVRRNGEGTAVVTSESVDIIRDRLALVIAGERVVE